MGRTQYYHAYWNFVLMNFEKIKCSHLRIISKAVANTKYRNIVTISAAPAYVQDHRAQEPRKK